MKFLNRVTEEITAVDGPESKPLNPGSANPENWVSRLQSGKGDYALRQDAVKLHDMLTSWQDEALEGHFIFEQLCMGQGIKLEQYLPLVTRDLSRQKLQYVIDICNFFLQKAPSL